MCGITGYTGKREAAAIIIDSLKRLEYRGYDSAGIAVLTKKGKINRKRCKGKIKELEKKLSLKMPEGNTAIGHTRWATHGKPSHENAHPHACCLQKTVVVHNGIIENYIQLRKKLIKAGHTFNSQTDSEVIAHLIESEIKKTKDLLKSVANATSKIKGSYALAIINSDFPGRIIAVRKDSPLIIGISEDGNFIASDAPAIIPYTRKVIYLKNNQIASIKKDSVDIFDESLKKAEKKISKITWDPVMAEKQGFRHFMLKEIYEQQRALQETLIGRLNQEDGIVSFENFNFTKKGFDKINKIFMVGCGTAYHACLIGKFLLEDGLKIPCEVDIASEFRYRNPPIDKNTLVITISQSGETA
ncbi:MAG: glutamine--fructose-6-phosphate transaminase (isomerizing), partial [Elusimicrobiota bacterium]